MTTTNAIDPVANHHRIERRVLFAERITLIVVVILTSVGFFVWGRSVAAQYTDAPWAQNTVGLIAAAISAFITDFAFREFLEDVIYQLIAACKLKPGANIIPWRKNNTPPQSGGSGTFARNLKILRWIILATIVGGLFYVDFYSVQTIRNPFAAQARQKPTADLSAVTADLATQTTAATAPMAAQIANLQKQIAQADRDIRTAETNAATKNKALRDLIAQGNTWATGELNRKKAQASATTRKHKEALQAQLDAANTNYNTALARQNDAITAVTTATLQKNQQIEAENLEQKYSLSGMYFMLGFGLKTLTILFRIFLVVSYLAKNPNFDANNDGIIDGRDVTASATSF